MKHEPYEFRDAQELLPLLTSIGVELEERSATLEELEAALETTHDAEDARRLVAEAATHRREIRLARQELSRLGCTVVGTTPVTIRIPGRIGRSKKSFVWQHGDPVLH